MAYVQKADFVFRRNGRVHLNRLGRQFSRLLATKVCASVVVMLDTPCSEVVWRVLDTHSIRQFPLHFPSRASPCAITFQLTLHTQGRRQRVQGPGENFFRGLQQGWTDMGKSEKTKKTESYAKWPLAEGTVNTTKSLCHYIWYCRERQKHTLHSRAPCLGNLYRLPLPPSTALNTPMIMAERYSRTRLPSMCDI
jgi:hypothetical protein